MSTLLPAATLEAVEHEHRVELAKLRMLLVRYRQVMEEHGITPPDVEGEELLRMWRDCRAVISTASEFVANLGSAKELLA
jgi:hypothetical protein